MPSIDKKESLRKLADIAEDIGFRVWFDLKQCRIHEMYGENAPRTPSDNDDSSGQNNQNNPGGNNNNFFRTNF